MYYYVCARRVHPALRKKSSGGRDAHAAHRKGKGVVCVYVWLYDKSERKIKKIKKNKKN